MQKVQAHDDDTLGSGSSIADLDNGTDSFGREIMQHERDARRLQNATRGDPQPVLKPRARPRISDLVGRHGGEEAAQPSNSHVRPVSSGSNDSNPPLNIPREWGTRAKSHRGWMRKIREPSTNDAYESGHVADKGLLTPEQEADGLRRTSYESDNIWNREDEQAGLLENTPPSMKRARPSSQHSTFRGENAKLRNILDSEDHEFSNLSLLTSTPATTKPVRLSRGDSEEAKRYDTTENRQDMLPERSPNRGTIRGHNRATDLEYDDKRTVPRREHVPRPATASYAEARIARRSGIIANKENVPVDDDRPHDHYSKANETVTIAERTARAVTFKQHQRPSHTRNGSFHLLQRLATSLSPSPGKSSSDAAVSSGNESVPKDRSRATRSHININEDGLGGPDQPVLRRAHRKSGGSSADDQDRRAQSTHTVDRRVKQNEHEEVDEKPASREEAFNDKTPIVTGAWVDTPAAPKETRPSLPNSHTAPIIPSCSKEIVLHNKSGKDNQESHCAPYRDPGRPKSVLEEIVRDARKDPTGTFGDATIQSLEDIVHPNTDPTDTTLSSEVGGSQKKEDAIENLDLGRPFTQAEKDRRQEDLAIEAMNKHLRAARTSIKDADRGLQRVENKWESSPSPSKAPLPALPSSNPNLTATATAALDRDWKPLCPHCGGSSPNSLWWGLWTELRSNFYVYDESARSGVRIRWPGILVLAWLLWNVVENVLCYYYCHPLYAEFMVGFGVNPDAPRYPLVIPTLLFRPLRPVWKPVVDWLEGVAMSGFCTVFGRFEDEIADYPVRVGPRMARASAWEDLPAERYAGEAWRSSSTWAGRVATAAVAAAGRATGGFVDAVDEMGWGTMNEDEYL